MFVSGKDFMLTLYNYIVADLGVDFEWWFSWSIFDKFFGGNFEIK